MLNISIMQSLHFLRLSPRGGSEDLISENSNINAKGMLLSQRVPRLETVLSE